MTETTNKNENVMEREAIPIRDRILSQKDLYELLPFGKTKIKQMVASGALPLTKVGKDYITTFDILQKWISDNIGSEIYFE